MIAPCDGCYRIFNHSLTTINAKEWKPKVCNVSIDNSRHWVMGLIDLSYLKTVSVDKQPYYGIMKQFRLGEANGLPGQPLDACA